MNRLALLPIDQSQHTSLPFTVIDGGLLQQQEDAVKHGKSNRIEGESSEVYAFQTREEIAAMISVFDRHIAEASGEVHRKIACRNKLLFLIGINVGIRGSDLRLLKWSFFFEADENGKFSFKKAYVLQPQKQKKQKKFVKLFFNQAVKTAVEQYAKQYPIENLNDYLFASQKGNEPVSVASLWRLIKETAKEAGLKQNIGSHSLRKTWGFFCFHEAADKNKALVILQQCFGHSSSQTTMRYIGLMDNEIESMYNSINLGL